MAIHLLHGCTSEWHPNRQIYHNFAPERALRSYLKSASKYQASVSSPKSHILTIDDSTKGAGRAAAIAREYGHEVRLFINPYQIESGEPYFFSLLNACIDNRRVSSIHYRGNEYDLTQGVLEFRAAAKTILWMLDPEAALKEAAEIGQLLNCGVCEIHEHAQTLSLNELFALKDMGVMIENHGWGHCHIDALSDTQLQKDVARSKAWLFETLGISSKEYAVPFGRTRRQAAEIESLADAIFLVGNTSDQIAQDIWTRVEITRELQSWQ